MRRRVPPLAAALLAAPLLLGAPGCLTRVVVAAMTPDAPFADVPPAPDYADPAAWTALPDRDDAADATLPDAPVATAPRADAFYVHPTSYVGPAWVAPVGDTKLNADTDRVATRIQASAFNGCCAVWGPRYRQANGTAFFAPSAEGARARDVAYTDVRTAFHHFLAKRDPSRPFAIAGHSQGAILATRLLVEEIAGTPLREKLVAAYLLGAPLTVATLRRDAPDVPVCDTPTQTGCVVAWNARSAAYVPGELEAVEVDGAGGPRVCVNPLTWTVDGEADASRHGGAVFLDADPPRTFPTFTGARCVDGTLVVEPTAKAPRDLPSKVLDHVLGDGNYHPIEVQMFWRDLRTNATERVEAWWAARAP